MKTLLLILTGLAVTLPTLRAADEQPDLLIGRNGGNLEGDDLYKLAKQKYATKLADGNRTSTFLLEIQNDGPDPDEIGLRGKKGNKHYRIDYFDEDGKNVTGAVTRGKYVTPTLNNGESVRVSGEVESKGHGKGKGGKRKNNVIRVRSKNDPSAKDGAKLVVILPKAS